MGAGHVGVDMALNVSGLQVVSYSSEEIYHQGTKNAKVHQEKQENPRFSTTS